MDLGQRILGRRHVDPNVAYSLRELQIEGTFPTGTHLVTIDQPISTDDGDLELAMYGSCVNPPPQHLFPPIDDGDFVHEKMAGCVIAAEDSGEITLSKDRKRIRLKVTNRGDRPVQVGSHYHFIETNPFLDFDRLKSYGYHLDIPSGTAARFEPGDVKTITLVEVGGLKTIRGGSSIAPGRIDLSMANTIIRRLQEEGFYNTPEDSKLDDTGIVPATMDRQSYAGMYGPTTGDLVRLSTMDLWIKVESDATTYGDECTFGGGKTIRDGIGQASGRAASDCLDLVITNALIVDWSGVYKADIGIRRGHIVGIGKAGNPDVMDGVLPNMVIGSNTDVIAGENKIITAGGIDTHCHFICPQQAEEALASGITTQFSGGTGPRYVCLGANLLCFSRLSNTGCQCVPVKAYADSE